MNAEPPSPAPPPLPVEIAPPAANGPWGFWATVGWSALIGFVDVIIQIVVVIVYAMGVVLVGKGEKVPPVDELGTNGVMMGIAVILCTPAVIGLSILFARLRRGPTVRDYLGLHWPRIKESAGWILGLLVLMVAIDWLTTALGRPIVPDFMVQVYNNTSFLPILWLAVVVAAPLSEEILFRGFLFRGLCESRIGGTATVFLTAGLWAMIHLQYDAYGIGMILAAGIVIGFARLKTGSVLLCVVMHALMNLLATIEVHYYVPKS